MPDDFETYEEKDARVKAEQLEIAHADLQGRDLSWVMSDARGRVFIHDLLYVVGNIDGPSMVNTDPIRTAYNEGARAALMSLLKTLKTERHLTEYRLMMMEAWTAGLD